MRTICPVNVPWLPNFFDIVAPMSGWVSVEGCVVGVCMGMSLGCVAWLVGIVVATSAIRMKAVAAAAAAGGNAAQSFTDTFCTTGSVVIGNWVTQTTPQEVVKIVPGNGSFIVTSTGDAGSGTFSYIITK